ncbi:MAG: hemolysin family protein [Spirochaetota bacterium]|nr:hemolysin family protein [Spirochaetota bacterium]
MENLLYEILIFILILCSAFFSGAETSIISANSIKLNTISQKGDRKAERALNILKNKDEALGMILIGNNISNISATSFITFIATKSFLFGEYELFIITTIQTIIFLIFCEIVPKIVARSKAESYLMTLSYLISILIIILKPAVSTSLFFSKRLQQIFNLDKSRSSIIGSRDEIGLLFKLGEREGIITNDHQAFVSEILSFKKITAEEVMTPTIDIVSIEKRKSIRQLVSLVEKTRFSRIPVYDKRVDNIIGYVHYRDILHKKNIEKIDDILKKPFYIPATKRISELLPEILESKTHLAFVVNEFGAVEGLVTKEDIAEEIVGEIQTRDHPDEELIKKISDKKYILSGSLDIDYFQKVFGIDIDKKGFETIAGFINYFSGKIPGKGDRIEYNGYTFIVDEATEKSVEKILLIMKDV